MGSGEASAAASRMYCLMLQQTLFGHLALPFAIMVLGGLMFYVLTKNYIVRVEGGGRFKFNESDPKVHGRIKLILKNPE